MTYFKGRIDAEPTGCRGSMPIWEYDNGATDSQVRLDDTSLPTFTPSFPKLYVNGEKLTDVMSDSAIGGTGFIVSERLKTILETYELCSHRFYFLETYQRGTQDKMDVNYYWLQIISSNFADWIDYEKSIFYRYNDFRDERDFLSIKNAAQLVEEVARTSKFEHQFTMYVDLYFTNHFKNYDLFFMRGLHTHNRVYSYLIFSETLKNCLESKEVKGLEFKQVKIYTKNA